MNTDCKHNNITWHQAIDDLPDHSGFLLMGKCNDCGELIMKRVKELPENFVKEK